MSGETGIQGTLRCNQLSAGVETPLLQARGTDSPGKSTPGLSCHLLPQPGAGGRHQPRAAAAAAAGPYLERRRRQRFGTLLQLDCLAANTAHVLKTSAKPFKAKREQSLRFSSRVTFSPTCRAPAAVKVCCPASSPLPAAKTTPRCQAPGPTSFAKPLFCPCPTQQDFSCYLQGSSLSLRLWS